MAMPTKSQVLVLFFFGFLSTASFAQTPAWKEYPIVGKTYSLSSDGVYMYIGSEGTLTRVRFSDGYKDYPITAVKAPYLFTNYNTVMGSNFRPVGGLAANPNRQEKYVCIGPDTWYKVNNGTWTVQPWTFYAEEYPDAKLANDGSVYTTGFTATGLSVLRLDSTGATTVIQESFTSGEADLQYDLDEDGFLWRLTLSPTDTVEDYALVGIHGADTITKPLYPFDGSGINPMLGLAARNGKVHALFNENFNNVWTGVQWLLSYDVVNNVILSDTVQLSGWTPNSVYLNHNALAATASNVFVAGAFANGEAVVYKYHNGLQTTLDHNAFGIAYDFIRFVKTDYNDNVFLTGYNASGEFVSYSSDGVNWFTVSLQHPKAQNQSSCSGDTYVSFPNNEIYPNYYYSNGNFAYALNPHTKHLTAYNDTNVVTEDISSLVPTFPYGFAASDNGVKWIVGVDTAAGQCYVYRIANGSASQTAIPGMTISVGDGYYNLAIAADDNTVCFFHHDTVWLSDGISVSVLASYPSGSVLDLLLNDLHHPAVLSYNTVDIYDGASWQSYVLPGQGESFLQRGDGKYMFLLDTLSNGNHRLFTFDGTAFFNTGLALNLTEYFDAGYNVPHVKRMSSAANGDLYVLDVDMGFNNVKPSVVKIDSALTTVVEVTMPPNSNQTWYADRFSGLFRAGESIVLFSPERLLLYNPQGVPGSLAQSAALNTLVTSNWYDYNNDGVRQPFNGEWYYGPVSLNHNGSSALYPSQVTIATPDTGYHYLSIESGAPMYYHFSQDTVSADFGSTYDNVANLDAFRLLPNPGTHNLKVSLAANHPQTGFEQGIWVKAMNIGAEPISGMLTLTMDNDLVANIDSITVPASTSGTELVWNIALSPGQQFDAHVFTTVPLTDTVGTMLDYQLLGTINEADIDLANNSSMISDAVVAAYDPNEKVVEPQGIAPLGLVDTGAVFIYTVYFQNTGNAVAHDIVVRDTLDVDLDLSTLEIESSSHPMDVNVKLPNALEFVFANIMLPDSNANEPMSHGYLKYKIKAKPTAGYGTQLTNTASIYFDYNAPVVTNTTLNTLGVVTGVASLQASNLSIELFPNPTNGLVTVSADRIVDIGSLLEVSDVAGRVVLRVPMDGTTAVLDCAFLATGVYGVKLVEANASTPTLKLAVIR
jgi:uncharacterized repeat protein (TIGR01451 family)